MDPPSGRRIRSVQRNWIQRNPRLFQTIVITSSLLVLFSRPIYDIFIRTDLKPSPRTNPFNK